MQLRLRSSPLLVGLVLGGLALPGCGQNKTVTETVTAEAPAAATTTEATEPATETTAEAKSTGDQSCDEAGITREGRKEGACTDEDGLKTRVVERSSVLNLNEISVKLLGIDRLGKTISSYGEVERADGIFVRVRLSIRNLMSVPLELDTDKFGLSAGSGLYTASFEAMNGFDGTFVTNDSPIQPDTTRVGSLIFDVSTRNAKAIEQDGNVLVVQPSEDATITDGTAEGRIGVIRTYE